MRLHASVPDRLRNNNTRRHSPFRWIQRTRLANRLGVKEAGVTVLNQAIYANGNVATPGGCLSSQYLAAWVFARLAGIKTAERAMHYVAPVGEKKDYVRE